MIGLDVSSGLLIYLFLWLITIAVLWVRELWRVKKQDWNINKNRLFRCKSCHYSFLGKDEHSNIVRCPRCNAMCIAFKNQ